MVDVLDIQQFYVVDVYNKIADHFDKTRPFQWSWITDFINKTDQKREDNSKSTVLDIGCGNGRNMSGFNNVEVSGIDNCSNFIQICKKKGLFVRLADMRQIPFPDHYFNHLMCIAAFHHLATREDRVQALREMRRIIKYNGSLLLSVWSINQPEKSKQKFSNYGNTFVSWNKNGEKYDRFYYIFEKNELESLFRETGWMIQSYKWDYGNEIYILMPT